MNSYDYALEKRLNELDKNLSKIFTNIVFSMQFILSRYKVIFPYFTDHTIVHSLNVIEFCNKIIGEDVKKLNADEIFILLFGCYLHDSGMGISLDDYIESSKKLELTNCFDNKRKSDVFSIVRNYHHEYSGQFVEKYGDFFEIPTEKHKFAIKQVCRGHRKVNLEDENEFPSEYKLDNGNIVRLPYLAAIIRLADEIDVTANRNSLIEFDYTTLENEIDLLEFMKHDAVKDLIITDDAFIMKAKTDDQKVIKALDLVKNKMQKTLDECRKVVNGKAPFEIRQAKIVIEYID